MTGDEIIRRFRSYPFGSAVFQRDCIAWARRMLETSGSGQVLSDSDWLYSTMNQRVTNSCISKDLENDKVFRT